jgi:hypothetical protein
MIASQREGWAEASRGWSERERTEAGEAIDAFVQRQTGKSRERSGTGS